MEMGTRRVWAGLGSLTQLTALHLDGTCLPQRRTGACAPSHHTPFWALARAGIFSFDDGGPNERPYDEDGMRLSLPRLVNLQEFSFAGAVAAMLVTKPGRVHCSTELLCANGVCRQHAVRGLLAAVRTLARAAKAGPAR